MTVVAVVGTVVADGSVVAVAVVGHCFERSSAAGSFLAHQGLLVGRSWMMWMEYLDLQLSHQKRKLMEAVFLEPSVVGVVGLGDIGASIVLCLLSWYCGALRCVPSACLFERRNSHSFGT